ncbi:MAG: WG repeat-containing protein, partial [Thermoleophilia bacterium]|nr:WG repeat-containing protein [Thermoleophilia bacterium]
SLAPNFSHGLCVVTVKDDGPPPSVTSTSLVDTHGYKYGYINKTGAVVIAAQFNRAWHFSEGLAAVSSDAGLVGFIDTSGGLVVTLPPNLMSAIVPSSGSLWSSFSFSEGLAIVSEIQYADATQPPSETNRPGLRYGYVDKTGKVMIAPQFDEARFFSEGLAAVAVEENGAKKWGYVDQKGAWVIEPRFDGAGDFSNGLASVGFSATGGSGPVSDWRSDYIDKTGKTVISLEPGQTPSEFSGGVARVVTTGSAPDAPRSTSYIDTTGKVIWQGE